MDSEEEAGLVNVKDILLQEYANWICENSDNCDEENNFKIWLDDTVTQDGNETLNFMMKGGKAFSMICPPLYPNHDGQFVILAEPGLQEWLETLTEYLFECTTKVTLSFVLDKAVSVYDIFLDNYNSVSKDNNNQMSNNCASVTHEIYDKSDCVNKDSNKGEEKLLEDFKIWSAMNKKFFTLKRKFKSDGCICLDIGTPSNKVYTLMCPCTYPTYDGSYFVSSCTDLEFWAHTFNEFLLTDLQSNSSLSVVLDYAMNLYNTYYENVILNDESTFHRENDNALVAKSTTDEVFNNKITLLSTTTGKTITTNEDAKRKYKRRSVNENLVQPPCSNLKLRSEFENAVRSHITGIEIDLLHYDTSCRISFSKFPDYDNLNSSLLKLKSKYRYDYIQIEIGFDVTTSYPCLLKVIRPRLKPEGVLSLLRMDDFRFFHWNPKKSLVSVLKSVRETLQNYAQIDVDFEMNDNLNYPAGSYYDIEHDLFHLAFVSGVHCRIELNKEDNASRSLTFNSMLTDMNPDEVIESGSSSQSKKVSKPCFKCNKRRKYNSSSVKNISFVQARDEHIVSALRNIIEHLKRRRETIAVNTYSRLSRSPRDYFQVFESSCLVPFLESELRAISFFEMDKHFNVLQCITDVICELSEHPDLVPLFKQLPSQIESLSSIIKTLDSKAAVLLKQVAKLPVQHGNLTTKMVEVITNVKGKQGKKKISKKQVELETEITHEEESPKLCMAEEKSLALKLCEMNRTVTEKLQHAEGSSNVVNVSDLCPSTSSKAVDTMSSLSESYISQLKHLQFSECNMNVSGAGAHSFAKDFNSSTLPSSKLIMRIAKDLGELSTSLPLSLQSAIFVRTDDSKLTLLRALIIGPQGTPYTGGCFVFDIFIPYNYPTVPPKVKFLTTGGGKVRFNPNLYDSGHVCLSLLGTWTGPQWNKNASTLLQILVSIQSLVFVPEPYFNEPGFERFVGTTTGKTASQIYNDNIFLYTVQHAIIDQIIHPSPGFEDVIRTHFRIKKDQILDELKAQVTRRHSYNLDSKIAELQSVLTKV